VAFTFLPGYSFGALSTDAAGDTFAVSIVKPGDTRGSHPQVAVYHRSGTWYTRTTGLTPPGWIDTARGTEFGTALAVSSDGTFVAVGDGSDDAQGQGVYSPPLAAGGRPVGVVYVMEHLSSGGWRLRRLVKPNYTPGSNDGPVSGFGRSVALAQRGKTLAVGHPGESTHVANPDDDQENPTGTESGAVWLY
jgi:hypothetical protein